MWICLKDETRGELETYSTASKSSNCSSSDFTTSPTTERARFESYSDNPDVLNSSSESDDNLLLDPGEVDSSTVTFLTNSQKQGNFDLY